MKLAQEADGRSWQEKPVMTAGNNWQQQERKMNDKMVSDNHEVEARADDRTPALVEKFVIRLPNGLRDQIRSLSEQNRRSMNSEIIMVLEKHIRQKFMDQMAAANPDGNFKAGERNTELELSRRLENLPAEKKEALLELLG
jgi:hypothetical protein